MGSWVLVVTHNSNILDPIGIVHQSNGQIVFFGRYNEGIPSGRAGDFREQIVLENVYSQGCTLFMKDIGPFWRDSLDIKIDKRSSLPSWIQITCNLAGQVARQRVKIGEFCISIRSVALLNDISVCAIAKAYNLLVSKKILEPVPSRGFLIGKSLKKEADQILKNQIYSLIIMAKQLELERDELLIQLRNSWF